MFSLNVSSIRDIRYHNLTFMKIFLINEYVKIAFELQMKIIGLDNNSIFQNKKF